jgi:hypothetical protein
MDKVKDLAITEEYLLELIDYCSRCTCGKIMKRHEILGNTGNAIKLSTKELIYEGFRELRDLIIAHNKGRDITIFKFKKNTNHLTQEQDKSAS